MGISAENQDDGATQRFEIYKDVQARLELDVAILRGKETRITPLKTNMTLENPMFK